ncbi:MAG: SAM-dependent DNA methyltransferase, partial [Kiritimatiellae bacterium]|nr:SAM-dependent DNA methyltransferase [Kiritimatiellia bacterium]
LYSDYKDVEDYSRVVDVSEIAAKGYDLSVNKYVKYHEEAVKPYAEVKSEFEAAAEAVKVVSEKFRALLAKGGYLK